jgi:predicted transposase YbfD/YdcC
LITQVKNNQKFLLKQITHGCTVQKPIETQVDHWEKQHGRLEKRRYEVFNALPMLNKWQEDWPYIEAIIRVTRYRERLNSDDKASQETHYFVSNGRLLAKEYGQCIRNHWAVENKANYVKDVAFQEDTTIKRVNPFIFSTCISFAMNRLRCSGINDIKKTIYEASLDIFKFLEEKNLLDLTSTP